MKVIFDLRGVPFFLVHGGVEVQISRTREALESLGVETEYARWWDSGQTTDVIHCFGRAEPSHILFAHRKGFKYVMAELLTSQGSRSLPHVLFQGVRNRALRSFGPRLLSDSSRWEAYQLADAMVALTPWEKRLMHILYSAPRARVRVVPNGVEPEFFIPEGARRGSTIPHLVCTTTITQRKRVHELARAAIHAEVPVWIIGKPYGESDPYYPAFVEIVKQSRGFVRYEGPIGDRHKLAEIYRNARGFVLLSAMESLSLSALEAAASGCPLLLSDLPWARQTFGETAQYCPVTGRTVTTATCLRQFYDAAPSLPAPEKPMTWIEVARQLLSMYEEICR